VQNVRDSGVGFQLASRSDDVVGSGRAVSDLRALRELTGDERGAQRLAWTDTWARARDWLRERLAELPVHVDADEAGNLWAPLPGWSERTVVLGRRVDSVPDGGWLDGALGVLGGRLAAGGQRAQDLQPYGRAPRRARRRGAARARGPRRAHRRRGGRRARVGAHLDPAPVGFDPRLVELAVATLHRLTTEVVARVADGSL
jgi:hypothetical protein